MVDLAPARSVQYPHKQFYEEVCMRGGIYSDQKCPVCGGNFRNNFKGSLIT